MRKASIHTPVLIIGAGPAGNTAAIYAARAALTPLVLAGPEPGGQLMGTTDVENYPGFSNPVQGPWLMDEMMAQAKACGAQYIYETVDRIACEQRPFSVWTNEAHYTCDTLILATGAQAKWLGLSSENTFKGYGVSSCATCDGFFFRGQEVAVVGGGNTAAEDALYLARHAKKVTLIHRRDTLRADKTLQGRLLAHDKITLLFNYVVKDIQGVTEPLKKVTGVVVEDLVSGAQKTLPVAAVFVAIGHTPSTNLVKDILPLNALGYVDCPTTATPIPGLYTAGDVRDHEFRQAITAAGEGCQAALLAEKYLTLNGATRSPEPIEAV